MYFRGQNDGSKSNAYWFLSQVGVTYNYVTKAEEIKAKPLFLCGVAPGIKTRLEALIKKGTNREVREH